MVAHGALRNNSATASAISVGTGATLGGIGSSQGVIIGDGGRFAPGNSIGAYTTTSLAFGANSQFDVEFSNGVSDIVSVTGGPVLIGGRLNLSYYGPSAALSTEMATWRFSIIQAEGANLSGAFGDIVFDAATASLYPKITPHAEVFANRVEVYFTIAPGIPSFSDVNLGATHVGQSFVPGSATISNIADIGSANLDVSLMGSGVSPATIIASSNLNDIHPGTSQGAAVTLPDPVVSGPAAGLIVATAVSYPGAVAAGTGLINVTGTAYEYAEPAVASSVNLGSMRRGSAFSGTFNSVVLPVTNLAVSPIYGEKLSATMGVG